MAPKEESRENQHYKSASKAVGEALQAGVKATIGLGEELGHALTDSVMDLPKPDNLPGAEQFSKKPAKYYLFLAQEYKSKLKPIEDKLAKLWEKIFTDEIFIEKRGKVEQRLLSADSYYKKFQVFDKIMAEIGIENPLNVDAKHYQIKKEVEYTMREADLLYEQLKRSEYWAKEAIKHGKKD